MHKIRALLGVIVLSGFLLASGVMAQPPEPVPRSADVSQRAPHSAVAASPEQPPTLLALRGVIVSTESLLGSKIRNLQGDQVGTVEHLLINPRTGLVLYAVVSMGGFLGLGEKTLVVPWQAMEVTRDKNTLLLNVSQQWLQQSSTSTGSPLRGTLPATSDSPGLARSGDWGPDTPYGRLYNPAEEQTISGEVVKIDTGPPMPGMASGVQLVVKTEADETRRIQVGPEWYLEHQDVEIVEHMTVQVTGARAEIDGQAVLLARVVQFDGHTLTLRDAQGMPLWSGLRARVSP